ncbi:MAG TPA: OmpH family outer membrane protein [Candidatus Obscuribacterales bacterium]
MTSKFAMSAVVAAGLALATAIPSFAAGSAQPTSVKFGYFNLALVKASYPEAAGSEALRVQAENQLRANVEAGNSALKKMQDEKKSKEEIEKAARDLQTQINAQQQALIQLVQTNSAQATQAIAQAVAAVAKEKSLDVVVDGAGVFAGGEKLVNNGEDITEAIVKKLSPAGAIRTSGK